MCYLVSTSDIVDTLVNTVVGMGTVFVALIVISAFIGAFAFIPGITNAFETRRQKRYNKKHMSELSSSESTVFTSEVNDSVIEDDEEYVDDCEIVAAITAALMAYIGDEVSDGLVVRSIKRARHR